MASVGNGYDNGAAGKLIEPTGVRSSRNSLFVDRTLELIAAFIVITSLLGLAATLVGVFFAPQVLIASIFTTGCYGWYTRYRPILLPGARPKWGHLGILIVVGLFFRVPAYNYVLGDQDEGIYVNIAQHIARTGTDELHDRTKSELAYTPYLDTYLSQNYARGGFLPGIYSHAHGQPIFQFYHLFSIWMALFIGLFGSVYGVYALTFFAILSLLYFYRLALLLTQSGSAALLAGCILAVNPLHAFFSKFPVTEIPALAFSLVGFTLFLGWWMSEAKQPTLSLVLSVLAFFCLFTTRISGFMYIPFVYLVGLAALIFDVHLGRKWKTQYWVLGIIVVYVISIGYGYHISPYYSDDIYRTSFGKLLKTHWQLDIGLLVLFMLVVWAGAALIASPRSVARKWVSDKGAQICTIGPQLIVAVALAVSVLKVYRLGWTGHFDSDSWLNGYWHLANSGWEAAAASSLWAIVVYTGPLVIAWLVLLFSRMRSPALEFLRWFVAGFFAYIATLQWVLPYAPYYTRYLVSELVPYSLLFTVCAWAMLAEGGKRASLALLIFGGLVYGAVLSAQQIGKGEDQGAYSTLSALIAPVDSGDLILLDAPPVNLLKAPLMFTFGRHVVTVGKGAVTNAGYLAKLNSLYDDVFLISPDAAAPLGFVRENSVRFKAFSYTHTHGFPKDLTEHLNEVLYLYRLESIPFPPGSQHSFAKDSPWLGWLSAGWSTPEPWGVWSDAKHALLAMDGRMLGIDSAGELKFGATAFVTAKHPEQQVTVEVNGAVTGHYVVRYPKTDWDFSIPLSAQDLARPRIVISFALPDAVSPKSLGLSADPRTLGIGLKYVQLQQGNDGTGKETH